MQSQKNNQHPNAWREWLVKNMRVVTIFVVVILFGGFIICQQEVEEQATTKISFDPHSGAMVDDSLGNGDKQLNPGEQVKVRLAVTNVGKEPISAFSLSLSTHEQAVTLIDDRIRFGAIDTGKTVFSEDAFEFSLDSLFAEDCVVFLGKIEKGKSAGFGALAFANLENPNGEITIPLSVLSNYRICVVSSNLLAKTSANPDTLVITLNLCNVSVASFWPSLYIAADTVKICDKPAASFTTLQEPHAVTGLPVNMDRMGFVRALASRECLPPQDPGGRPVVGQFKFTVAPQNWTEPVVCVYFTVTIFATTDLTTPRGHAFIGAQARIIPPPIASLASSKTLQP